MPNLVFGSGSLWAVNTTANSTPFQFGVLQEVSVDFASSVKELFGQYQFPQAVGRGTMKVTGTAKHAEINGRLWNDLFFGIASTTGRLEAAANELGTIPDTPGPYTVTVAQSATWVDDLGVQFTSNGYSLKKVASGPATGEYSVAAGVYTFAAADKNLTVYISYTYTVAAQTYPKQKTVLTNQLLGTQPEFAAYLRGTFEGKNTLFKFHRCVATKITLATKLEDFVIPDFGFSCFCDSAGELATYSTDE